MSFIRGSSRGWGSGDEGMGVGCESTVSRGTPNHSLQATTYAELHTYPETGVLHRRQSSPVVADHFRVKPEVGVANRRRASVVVGYRCGASGQVYCVVGSRLLLSPTTSVSNRK
jgi:hypothetical protein